MSEWQPIETAPKNGEYVLLFHPGHKGAFYPRDEVARWWVDRWTPRGWYLAAPSGPPTHWMPLPPPPSTGAPQ